MKHDTVVALLPWGNVIEDFLDTIGVTLESFCTTQTGGWLFGYISALNRAQICTHLICVSGRVRRLTHYVHGPTGAQVSVLPASNSFFWLQRRVSQQKNRPVHPGRIRRWLRSAKKELLPYLATPLVPLVSELRRARCAAIICQEYEYPRFDACVVAGKLLGIPVFGSYQGGNFHTARLEQLIRPLSIRFCQGLIIGSQRESTRVREAYMVPSSKIARIFNPLDPAAWHANDRMLRRHQLGIDEKAGVVIWHGRIDIRQKGLDTLLDAWKLVEREEKGNVMPRLLLVGTGGDADSLRTGIAERELKGVLWRNQYILDREQIRRYLAASDLFVLPSRHEGFAVAPLEAMACGLPLVATDVSGIGDLLEAGESSGGTVVPPDDPAQLARAILRMLCNPQLRRTVGEQSRRRIEDSFSLDNVGYQLRSFLMGNTANATIQESGG